MKALSNNARLALISATGLAASAAALGQTYSVQELPPLPGGNQCYAFGINAAGVVCGQSQDQTGLSPAVVWRDGVPQPLGILPGYGSSLARAINSQERIVGMSYSNSGGTSHGTPCTWENGVMTQLPLPAAWQYGEPFAVNEAGEIAGRVLNYDGATVTDQQACLWLLEDGQWTAHVQPSLSGPSWAFSINNNGAAVGFSFNSAGVARACLWQNGTVTELGHTPPDDWSGAWDIDDQGRWTGGHTSPQAQAQGILVNGPTITELGFVPGYGGVFPSRVNAAGTIVGHAYNLPWNSLPYGTFIDCRAIVWRSGELRTLNSLLVPADPAWDIRQAWSMNASGRIAAISIHNGAYRAALLIPCYPNCDSGTTAPTLNVNDFICFQSKFAAGDTYANCDGSSTPPVLNVNDFICFQTRFAAGCQ